MSMYKKKILRRVREQRVLHEATLELTYSCNLDCFYCYNDLEKAGNPLSLDQYETLLTDMARMQTLYLMLTGGEPMIHPHFFAIGAIARKLGFVVRVRTNGHSLSLRNCVRLINEVDPYIVEVSLHGATAETHDRQTRVEGSFKRLVKNIRTATESGLRLEVVTTPTAWNEHQIEAMFALCDDLGVPLRFQGPVAPRDNGDTSPLTIQPLQATWDKVTALVTARRQAGLDSGEAVKSSGDKMPEAEPEEAAMCSVGVAGVDIDPYGNVQACMHLQESAGNLHEQSIEEIWNHSSLFQRARKRAVDAALQFTDTAPTQFGAPLFCIAVEENANKGCSPCSAPCRNQKKSDSIESLDRV
ncbi:MAG: MoaA/NifB/PqqE/SkfB family radical SAM enzyme [Lysobacterales bacterium]|jgi:MoaA/NifB/PqqE/SkfB family radical SAM enzyme